MAHIQSDLKAELESDLSENAITGIEEGELAIFVTQPGCSFFRFDDGTYERADVYFNVPTEETPEPKRLSEKEYVTRVESTTADDVLARVREQDEIYVCNVAMGFGDGSSAETT